MMERLQEALATLTPRQASCLHARFWEGKPFKEIAEAEGFTTSAAIVTVPQRHYQVAEILYQARLDESRQRRKRYAQRQHRPSETEKDEREEVLKEIRQLENRQKILENKQRNAERKARTRRLIERGPLWRAFSLWPPTFRRRGQGVPDCPVPIFRGRQNLAAKLPKIRGQAVSPLFTRAHLYTVAVSCALPGAVAYFVRDGELHSPNPLCVPRSQTPASRLFGSTEPEISPPKGGATHRFLPYPRQYHQAQRGPFRCCRSRLPKRNQADE